MPHRFVIRKLKNWFIYRVLHVDDTPHRIALGVAIGIFICWTPTMPFQMILTFSLSWLLGANKFVGLPFVWLSNPLTLVPIYGPSYVLGSWLIGSDFRGFHLLIEATRVGGGFVDKFLTMWDAFLQVFWELWAGSVLVALVLGVLCYFAVYRMVVVYRRFRHRHVAQRAAEGEAGPR
jgi:hypothetical protein